MSIPDKQWAVPTVAPVERRRFPRYTVQVQVELRQEGNDVPMRLTTTDLSRNGCYVEMLLPLSVAIRVQATLWLHDEPVVTRGCVVTRHPQFGNGIMFLEFDGDGEQRLAEYLDEINND